MPKLFQTVKIHPEYKVKQKYHDIALLELEEPVEFTSYIWPACLQPPSYEVGDILTIAGFGRIDTKDGKEAESIELADYNDNFQQLRSLTG